ncbi:MAG: 1-acyl-sn-glycerol-3-phosphate acyltransferase [Candidatus Omnitrophica bacterium]|nr:1-acyl-sn-glycerol-3-phosphate acyltransferase [Candidatus Omnitrophota bacterium]
MMQFDATPQASYCDFRRLLTSFVLLIFSFSSLFPDPRLFALSVSEAEPELSAALRLSKLPAEIGAIESIYQGKDERTLLLIQDAHALPDAQHAIRKLIDYFQNQGVKLIALEGTSGQLDPTLFRTLPDEGLLKEVFHDYLDRGELSGVSAAAVLNRKRGLYYGVENKALYEEGIALFLEAREGREQILRKLKQSESKLNQEKARHYSAALLELDHLLRSLEGADFSNFPAAFEKISALSPIPLSRPESARPFRHLSAFAIEIKKQEEGGKNQASDILEKATGESFFKEWDEYVRQTKKALFRSDKERELDIQSRELALLKKLAQLKLSREEWEEVKAGPDDNLWTSHFDFYRNAEVREGAFFENLTKRMSLRKTNTAILVAGGFHTDGLAERLKKKGISYAIISPAIKNSETKDYEAFMRGEVSWKDYFIVKSGRLNLYESFARATVDRLLKTGQAQGPAPTFLKRWRNQIIKELAQQGKLAKAGEYTRFLDRALLESFDKKQRESFRQEWIEKVEEFIQGLRGLKEKNQLTSENLIRLTQPAHTVQFYAANPLRPGLTVPVRSELRSKKLKIDAASVQNAVTEMIRTNGEARNFFEMWEIHERFDDKLYNRWAKLVEEARREKREQRWLVEKIATSLYETPPDSGRFSDDFSNYQTPAKFLAQALKKKFLSGALNENGKFRPNGKGGRSPSARRSKRHSEFYRDPEQFFGPLFENEESLLLNSLKKHKGNLAEIAADNELAEAYRINNIDKKIDVNYLRVRIDNLSRDEMHFDDSLSEWKMRLLSEWALQAPKQGSTVLLTQLLGYRQKMKKENKNQDPHVKAFLDQFSKGQFNIKDDLQLFEQLTQWSNTDDSDNPFHINSSAHVAHFLTEIGYLVDFSIVKKWMEDQNRERKNEVGPNPIPRFEASIYHNHNALPPNMRSEIRLATDAQSIASDFALEGEEKEEPVSAQPLHPPVSWKLRLLKPFLIGFYKLFIRPLIAIHVEGLENLPKKNFILMSTHFSLLDGLILSFEIYLRTGRLVLMMANPKDLGVFQNFLLYLGLAIKIEGKKEGMTEEEKKARLARIVEGLRSHVLEVWSVGGFPSQEIKLRAENALDGPRNKQTGEVEPWRDTLARVAVQVNEGVFREENLIQVVPVVLWGNIIYGGNRKWPRFRRMLLRWISSRGRMQPFEFHMKVLPPINPKSQTSAEIMDQVKAIIKPELIGKSINGSDPYSGSKPDSKSEPIARSEVRNTADAIIKEQETLLMGVGEREPDWHRTNVVGHAFLDILRPGPIKKEEILAPVVKKLEGQNLNGQTHRMDYLLSRLVKEGLLSQSEKGYELAVQPEVFAIKTNHIRYILRDLEAALEAVENKVEHAKLQLEILLKQYAKATQRWPLYEGEARWPVLKAVRLLKQEKIKALLEFLEKRDGDLIDLPLIDSILLMSKSEVPQNWLRRFANNLRNRMIYYVSPETQNAAGGLGRVGQYHTTAAKLLMASEARLATIEPWYPFRFDKDNKLIRDVDYRKLPTPIENLSRTPLYEFEMETNKGGQRKIVIAQVFKGSKNGVDVYLIKDKPSRDGEDEYFTKLLYKYGPDFGSATWEEFTEFFSAASLKLIESLEEDSFNKNPEGYKSPVIWGNDGQLGPLPLMKRIHEHNARQAKERYALENALVWMTTHTYRNRGFKGWEFPHFMNIPKEWWTYFKHRDSNTYDSTSAGVRAADGSNGVAAVHVHEVSIYDPIRPLAITNGDDLSASSTIYRSIFDSQEFQKQFPGADSQNPTPEQNLEAKKRAKEFLRDNVQVAALDPAIKKLDPHKIVFSYSGRLVEEKVGRDRSLSDNNIRGLVHAGAQVVIFGNVQSGPESAETYRRLRILQTEVNQYGSGLLVVATGWGIPEQRYLLPATDAQINDSLRERYNNRGTEAAGFTETDVAVNGGIEIAPPYIEGIYQQQGEILDWNIPGSGNTTIPEDESEVAWLRVLLKVLREFNRDRFQFAAYQVTSVRLSGILNARLPAAEYLRQFNNAIERKEHPIQTVRQFAEGKRVGAFFNSEWLRKDLIYSLEAENEEETFYDFDGPKENREDKTPFIRVFGSENFTGHPGLLAIESGIRQDDSQATRWIQNSKVIKKLLSGLNLKKEDQVLIKDAITGAVYGSYTQDYLLKSGLVLIIPSMGIQILNFIPEPKSESENTVEVNRRSIFWWDNATPALMGAVLSLIPQGLLRELEKKGYAQKDLVVWTPHEGLEPKAQKKWDEKGYYLVVNKGDGRLSLTLSRTFKGISDPNSRSNTAFTGESFAHIDLTADRDRLEIGYGKIQPYEDFSSEVPANIFREDKVFYGWFKKNLLPFAKKLGFEHIQIRQIVLSRGTLQELGFVEQSVEAELNHKPVWVYTIPVEKTPTRKTIPARRIQKVKIGPPANLTKIQGILSEVIYRFNFLGVDFYLANPARARDKMPTVYDPNRLQTQSDLTHFLSRFGGNSPTLLMAEGDSVTGETLSKSISVIERILALAFTPEKLDDFTLSFYHDAFAQEADLFTAFDRTQMWAELKLDIPSATFQSPSPQILKKLQDFYNDFGDQVLILLENKTQGRQFVLHPDLLQNASDFRFARVNPGDHLVLIFKAPSKEFVLQTMANQFVSELQSAAVVPSLTGDKKSASRSELRAPGLLLYLAHNMPLPPVVAGEAVVAFNALPLPQWDQILTDIRVEAGRRKYLEVFAAGQTFGSSAHFFIGSDDEDEKLRAFSQQSIAGLEKFVRNHFLKTNAERLHFAFAIPFSPNPVIQEWVLEFLKKIQDLSKSYKITADIRIFATSEQLAENPAFFEKLPAGHAKAISLENAKQAIRELNTFLAQNPNALAYGLPSELQRNVLKGRSVQLEEGLLWEQAFAVSTLLHFKTAEALDITAELIKQILSLAALDGVIGYNAESRSWIIHDKAREILLQAAMAQLLESAA